VSLPTTSRYIARSSGTDNFVSFTFGLASGVVVAGVVGSAFICCAELPPVPAGTQVSTPLDVLPETGPIQPRNSAPREAAHRRKTRPSKARQILKPS
jgi:hypothetical protein